MTTDGFLFCVFLWHFLRGFNSGDMQEDEGRSSECCSTPLFCVSATGNLSQTCFPVLRFTYDVCMPSVQFIGQHYCSAHGLFATWFLKFADLFTFAQATNDVVLAAIQFIVESQCVGVVLHFYTTPLISFPAAIQSACFKSAPALCPGCNSFFSLMHHACIISCALSCWTGTFSLFLCCNRFSTPRTPTSAFS